MCLSKIFISENSQTEMIFEEAVRVQDLNGTVDIQSIFGENKKVSGYYIKEVNLNNNQIILSKINNS